MKKIRRALVVAAIGLSFSALGWGQSPSQIVLQISMLSSGAKTCSTAAGSNTVSVISWSFSEDHPAVISAQTASKAKFNDFLLTKAFDECSAALFQNSATGVRMKATLTQRDKLGHVLMTIVLNNAVLTQYALTDGGSSGSPVETIALAYEIITISNPNNNSSGCWNILTQTAQCPL